MEQKDVSFIQPGDVLLYHSHNLISKVIRFFIKSPFSHASLVVELWGELFIAESTMKGLTVSPLRDSIKGSKILILKPKMEIDPIKINKFVIPLLGKHKYDLMSSLIFQFIFLITGKWIGLRGVQAKNRLYCSEFVAFVFFSLYNIFPDWYEINPRMIFENPNFDHFVLGK